MSVKFTYVDIAVARSFVRVRQGESGTHKGNPSRDVRELGRLG